MDERAAKEYLLEHDEEFRKLFEEHQQWERRLAELIQKPFLTSDEQLEEVRIKKRKLFLKDRMQWLINSRQSQQVVQ
ncbi:MAG TPA: YdcH family protein [Acidobacteriota bacterium]|nr:YdcH family protein [Acidobacteriota bacterium]